MRSPTSDRLRKVVIVLSAWAVITVAVLATGWLLTHPLASGVDPWDNGASRWFASRIDARWVVRRVCAEIMRKREKPLEFPKIDTSLLPKEN